MISFLLLYLQHSNFIFIEKKGFYLIILILISPHFIICVFNPLINLYIGYDLLNLIKFRFFINLIVVPPSPGNPVFLEMRGKGLIYWLRPKSFSAC